MKPRKEPKQDPKAVESRKRAPRPKLQIVKLEERIAPKLATNHNETLVREPTKAKPKAEPRKAQQKPKLQIAKLEERIAPRPIPSNHNETLVRDRG